MGRGLSELQKRLLVYAKTGPPNRLCPGTCWLYSCDAEYHPELKAEILPETRGHWTPSVSVAVSRALDRLEKRGLIIRVHWATKKRTEGILLTPRGEDLVAFWRRGEASRARADGR